jgi:pyrroloquinoline quinone (PQQ) biosynthesis protein C
MERRIPIDESEMIDVNERFRVLKDDQQGELGALLCDSWKKLAGMLGLSNEEIRKIELSSSSNKAYEVLKVWRVRRDTTIRVLRQMLVDMQHDEAVNKLDDIRCGKFSICRCKVACLLSR